ncbi:uncharacterized protein LOC134443131 [Engraulis encrasicolus]|uniref:uncharacterized protein LOC134443131 n=1 Tax=Engraulis encrasicolus TaxID=184585 RepID=UPI002FD13268
MNFLSRLREVVHDDCARQMRVHDYSPAWHLSGSDVTVSIIQADMEDTSADTSFGEESGAGPSTSSRSRGRGRPRNRSRSTRRRGDLLSQEDVRRINNLRTERLVHGRGQIRRLSLDQAHEVLDECFTENPGLIFNILRRLRDPQAAPPPGSGQPSWCVCGRCREMPTLVEQKCCSEVNCVTLLPEMEAYVLDQGGLSLARVLWNDLRVLVEEEHDRENTRQFRHAAYRQYIAWTRGTLGAGRRVVIPSCCVWAIRDRFPDPDGQYRGFVPRRV